MKNFWLKNKDKLITFVICGTIFIGILSLIALISGFVMRMFGFQYESIGSIILFFIIAAAISYPLNLLAGALPKALFQLERIGKRIGVAMYLVLDTAATSVGLAIVDYFMSSISATTMSILLISFLLALPNRGDFMEE